MNEVADFAKRAARDANERIARQRAELYRAVTREEAPMVHALAEWTALIAALSPGLAELRAHELTIADRWRTGTSRELVWRGHEASLYLDHEKRSVVVSFGTESRTERAPERIEWTFGSESTFESSIARATEVAKAIIGFLAAA